MTQARFNHLDVFQEARCLVETVGNGIQKKRNLRIIEDVLRQIKEIDVPISVVGICGAYRKGKSFLMNRLAGARKGLKGFEIGSTVRSKTKGIWVLCKVHPKHPNQVLVFLDTEGLSDAEKGDEEHDMKLFCLTMLMSSALIYNMRGEIDHDSLKKLSFITEVSKMVCVYEGTFATKDEETDALKLIPPNFVLCLRDFGLDLEGLTSDQYMESCLEESDKTNKLTNDIRKRIKDFFLKRKCFTMSMPAPNKKLKGLGNLSEEELDEDFRTECQNMTTYIDGLGPKVLDNKTKTSWTGKAFDSFLRSYIEALSKDMKIDFGNAMTKAWETHNEELVVKYVQEFKEKKEQEKLPKPGSELADYWTEQMTSLLRELRKRLHPHRLEHYEDKAKKKMKKCKDNLLSMNSVKQKETCLDYLTTEYDKMMEKYENDVTVYKKDVSQLIENYKKVYGKFDEMLSTLEEFKNSPRVLKDEADMNLKAEKKKMAEENERREKERKKQVGQKENDNTFEKYVNYATKGLTVVAALYSVTKKK